MNILNDISQRTRERIEAKKKCISAESIIEAAEKMPVGDFPFERALRTGDIAFICEIKRTSPSKGVLAGSFEHVRIASEYAAAGAAAISVLTEPFYFHGSDDHLKDTANFVSIPVLRKDFVIDEYMIYEAKLLGADAILLICALLDDILLKRYVTTAHSLGLSVLAEVRDEKEITTALSAGARIIGVNNRDLRTFETDIAKSVHLRPFIPKDVIFVSESGIGTHEDVNVLRRIGADAVLIGETLMRAADKAKKIRELRGDAVG